MSQKYLGALPLLMSSVQPLGRQSADHIHLLRNDWTPKPTISEKDLLKSQHIYH